MKDKSTFKERVLDALLELLVAAAFVAVGAGLVILFGGDVWEIDFEWLALIGIGAFLAVAGGVGLIIYLIKKKRKKDNTNEPS